MSDLEKSFEQLSGSESAEKHRQERRRAFHGSGLFLKFFLWFWGAVVLTGIIVTIYAYFYHFIPENRKMYRIGKELLEENGQMIVEAYEKIGVEAALKFRHPGPFWLFDAELNNLFAGHMGKMKFRRKFPPEMEGPPPGPPPEDDFMENLKNRENEIRAIAARLLISPTSEIEDIPAENIIGSVITSESGKKYVIISHIPSKIKHQKFLLWRLGEAMPFFLFFTAASCLAMARYMVKPVAELSEASRKFAGGDLSARAGKSAESRLDEIGDLAVDFNEMADKIETLIRSQRRLFSDISHELRSPLARLQITVELLQKKNSEADQSMLGRIEKEIHRMNEMIEEVLNYSKLETENIEISMSETSLAEILQKVCNDASFEGKSRNCHISLRMSEKPRIKAAVGLIERAVENILRNALKYSPDNSEIEVSLEVVDKTIVISIADQGPGVPETELEKLFSPFYRYQEDRDRKTGGVGLGLAIAQRAIKLHKGTIQLENRPEGGLRAKIFLPAA